MLVAGNSRFIEKLQAEQCRTRTPSEASVLFLVKAQNDGRNYHCGDAIVMRFAHRQVLQVARGKIAEKNLCGDCAVSRQPATVAPDRCRVAGYESTAESNDDA